MDEQEKKSKKKKLAGAGIAGIAAVSMLVGGLFHSPSDVIAPSTISPPPIVQMVDDGDDERRDTVQTAEKVSKFRQWFQSIPMAVRALFGVPLWAIGSILLHALNLLWTSFLSPVVAGILYWLVGAAAIFAIMLCTLKSIFPNVPWRKLLNKRTIIRVLCCVAVLGVVDGILPFVFEGYSKYQGWVRVIGGFVIFGVWSAVRGIQLARERHDDETESVGAYIEEIRPGGNI